METLENVVKNSPRIPFTGFCIINFEEFFRIIREMRKEFPEELEQATWIKNNSDKIYDDAKKNSEKIIKNAENKVFSMLQDHEIVKIALEKGEKILTKSKKDSNDFYRSSYFYADNLMSEIENSISDLLEYLKDIKEKVGENRKSLHSVKKDGSVKVKVDGDNYE
ncbi:MAG: hypothetical protein LBJ09_01810 [Clostridiales bacterium]|jgi:hypothetical protein|nr:hypothetical protein [Clostridiales bacterium]